MTTGVPGNSPSNSPSSKTSPNPAPRPGSAEFEAYQTLAETLGGPSLRVKDTLIQTVCIVSGIVLGVAIGTPLALYNNLLWFVGAVGGGAVGMILATLVSGGVLMVLGWVRAANKLSGKGRAPTPRPAPRQTR